VYWDERFDESFAPVLYYSAKSIYNIAKPGEFGVFKALDEVTIAKDHSYTTLKAYQVGAEACIPFITEYIEAGPVLAIKYRTKTPGFYTEFFMDSMNYEATAGSNVSISVSADGYWNVAFIDVASKLSKVYDGKSLNYMRFDFVNATAIPANAYIDVAYIAFFNSVDDAQKFEYGADYKAPEFAIDPASGYHLAEVGHATCLEIVNGGSALAGGMGGDIAKGPEVINNVTYTIGNNCVMISGWTVVEGGFSKIVWSADGGKTWNDTSFNVMTQFNNGGEAHIGVAESRIKSHGGDYTFVDRASAMGACYQGRKTLGLDSQGVIANLSEYEGKTVSLAFCAIPKSDPTALCPIVFFESVRVGEAADDGFEEETEIATEIEIELPVTDFSDSIEEANRLSNTVNVYFDDADRSSLTVENNDVKYVLDLTTNGNQQITSLTGKNGGVFLENTSTAFIKTAAGRTFYSAGTAVGASTNIYRQGYYFFDVHVYGADFTGGITDYDKKMPIDPTSAASYAMTEKVSAEGGVLTYKVTDAVDPRVYYRNLKINDFNKPGYSVYEIEAEIYSATDQIYGSLYGKNGHLLKTIEYTQITNITNDAGDVTSIETSKVKVTIKLKHVTATDVEFRLDEATQIQFTVSNKYCLIADGQEGRDKFDTTHMGNQIAYELLGLGYTVLYKKLDPNLSIDQLCNDHF
jgi:hypothetical protein